MSILFAHFRKQNPSVILDRFTMKIDQTVEMIESEDSLDF